MGVRGYDEMLLVCGRRDFADVITIASQLTLNESKERLLGISLTWSGELLKEMKSFFLLAFKKRTAML